MTRAALIAVTALALTGCADVATNVAINVAGPNGCIHSPITRATL